MTAETIDKAHAHPENAREEAEREHKELIPHKPVTK